MEDKGTGIASALNWLMNCIIGAVTPYAITALTKGENGELDAHTNRVGYVFIFCSTLSFLGLLFIFKFMKETKGLSREQIDFMFSDQTDYKGAHQRLVED